MAKFTLEIELDNDAFTDDADMEIARLLRDAAKRVNGGLLGRRGKMLLRDVNGNTVGGYWLKEA